MIYVQDNFNRDSAAGWVSAFTGGAYTESLTGASSSVSSTGVGTGRISCSGVLATTAHQRLAAATPALDVSMSCRLRTLNYATTTLVRLYARTSGAIGAPVGYFAALQIQASGQVVLIIGHSAPAGAIVNIDTLIVAGPGSYVSGDWWRLEVEVVGSPTLLRARAWNTAAASPKPVDGWLVSQNDVAGPQVAGFYQAMFTRGAPATDPSQVIDLDDYWVTDPIRPAFTWSAATPLRADLVGNVHAVSGIPTPYGWLYGDGATLDPTTNRTPSHTYARHGGYRVEYRQYSPWSPGQTYRGIRDTVTVVDPVPEVRPIVTIEGVDMCDQVYSVSWGLGASRWADMLQGQTATIRLRGYVNVNVGDNVAISAPIGSTGQPLWQGKIDQHTVTRDTDSYETMVVAMDLASSLGRIHMPRGTSLVEIPLPGRLGDLRPNDSVVYVSRYPGVPGGRWPTLASKAWKADRLRDRTYLDLVRDAMAGSLAFGYVSRDGRIAYAPWDPPSGYTPFPTPYAVDSGIDCGSAADIDQDSVEGMLNRFTVGDGSNVDSWIRSSVEQYGENAFSVSTGVLKTETDFPLPAGMLSAMSNPGKAGSIDIPITRLDQKSITVSPLDLVIYNGVKYAVMGVRHDTSLQGWRVSLDLDRNGWALTGGSPP